MREAEQREADIAMFPVHEFAGPWCRDENLARNANDFAAFVRHLVLDWREVGEGLAGPVVRAERVGREGPVAYRTAR